MRGRADDVEGAGDGLVEELREADGDGQHAHRLDDLAVGAAEVGDEDDDCLAVAEVGDGGEGGADAGVVEDLLRFLVDGDVEVDAHEDALAGDIDVADGLLVHRWTFIDASEFVS